MGKIEIHDAALGKWKSFNYEKADDDDAVIITVIYEDEATAAYIANQIHDGLVGNEGYINNEVILNYEGSVVTIVVDIFSVIPKFLDAVLLGTEHIINTIF